MRSPFLRAFASAALLVATGSCGSVTDAAPPHPPATPAGGLLSAIVLPVVQRLLPLSSDQTASAVIGTAGGTISIPQAGFSITFPAGAVSAPVTVTATAVAGSNVAYRFEPHGLVFQKQPVISQDLGLTNVAGQLLNLEQATLLLASRVRSVEARVDALLRSHERLAALIQMLVDGQATDPGPEQT